MGAWGVGLYSNDFAQDLRSTMKAVTRLPFSPERLLELVCASEPQAATNSEDEDHTVFWLTVADQFAKRGIECPRARSRALAIIADDADLAMMAALGMDDKSLARRRVILEQVRARIADPIAAGMRRGVLKAPEKLLLEIGEVVAYPVCQGNPVNPYAVGKDWAWVKAWRQDGWGAAIIVDRGLAFDFLAWYAPLVLAQSLAGEPILADLAEPRLWIARQPGTLTPRHAANMQLKALGRVAIDPDRLRHFVPPRSGESSAVDDISICNSLDVAPAGAEVHPTLASGAARARIRALGDIADAPLMPSGSAGRALSGRWRGEYGYPSDKRSPVSFAAVLDEDNGQVRGEITETVVGADGAPLTRVASLEGRRLDWLVRFRKQYDASPARAVEYAGEVDEDATSIAGQWTIPGSWSGRFSMTRADE